jgi:hypothetical protein
MAYKTAWTPGSPGNYGWTNALAGSDMASMVDNRFVLSTVGDIANGTNNDLLADFSFKFSISSSTPRVGAFVSAFLIPLLHDGSTYGDGIPAAGTQTANIPQSMQCGTFEIQAVATTIMAGIILGIVLPPGTFRWGIFQYTNITLPAAGSCSAQYRVYDINNNG